MLRCKAEARFCLQAFCKDVQHGHAKIIRCLEENLEQPTFNATCKAEIQKHAANAATDYRCALIGGRHPALSMRTGPRFHSALKRAGHAVCCAIHCCDFYVTQLRPHRALSLDSCATTEIEGWYSTAIAMQLLQ